ncbi:hypothetical protein chiPu_0020956 [Chiloscyllium punctatum]|uniref:VWFC domain-containing protein n=1 Tax=Chiloscyllium punctatum TaxID=137246 RepID=A0A401RLJ0_CHIPU|nr:hypothetical protein [Chiloscyllium punctatum]
MPWITNISKEDQHRNYTAGTIIRHQCSTCVCQRGFFHCSESDCEECPDGEIWNQGDYLSCERSCQDVYSVTAPSCRFDERGCVCEAGKYRNSSGHCVTAAYCECFVKDHIYPGYVKVEELGKCCPVCRKEVPAVNAAAVRVEIFLGVDLFWGLTYDPDDWWETQTY